MKDAGASIHFCLKSALFDERPATRSPVLPADVKFRAGQKAGGRAEALPHKGFEGRD